MIGEPALRLHTARSRNDQVATDFKLWVRDLLDTVDAALADMQAVRWIRPTHADLLMPGLTHLQTAQPITFGFHLMAYVEMLGRSRFADARSRLNNHRWAAALAGTSFPIDRHMTATALGFDRLYANAMDQFQTATSHLNFSRSGNLFGSFIALCRRIGYLVIRSIWLYKPF